MSAACKIFQKELADCLRGKSELAPLGWHEHLLACGTCRELLEDEEALETLLASLPEPQLPVALAERVLARLEGARLEALLEMAGSEPAPADLPQRVRSGLAARRAAEEEALDRLLARVPEPTAPGDLAERVLFAVRPRPRRSPMFVLRALAAGLLLVLGAWWGWITFGSEDGQERPGSAGDQAQGQPTDSESMAPEPELLASLELLESWELLVDDDIDLLLSSLDPIDEALLELDASSESEDVEDPDEEGNG